MCILPFLCNFQIIVERLTQISCFSQLRFSVPESGLAENGWKKPTHSSDIQRHFHTSRFDIICPMILYDPLHRFAFCQNMYKRELGM
jgi:hypothetical protein